MHVTCPWATDVNSGRRRISCLDARHQSLIPSCPTSPFRHCNTQSLNLSRLPSVDIWQLEVYGLEPRGIRLTSAREDLPTRRYRHCQDGLFVPSQLSAVPVPACGARGKALADICNLRIEVREEEHCAVLVSALSMYEYLSSIITARLGDVGGRSESIVVCIRKLSESEALDHSIIFCRSLDHLLHCFLHCYLY